MIDLSLLLIVRISFPAIVIPSDLKAISLFCCWFKGVLSSFRYQCILQFLQLVCFQNVNILLLLSLFRSILLHLLCTDFPKLMALFLYLFLSLIHCWIFLVLIYIIPIISLLISYLLLSILLLNLIL